MRCSLTIGWLVAGLVLAPLPASATPTDAEVAAELSRLDTIPDADDRLAAADRLLARLDQPSRARAQVQAGRAGLLMWMTRRSDEAQEAWEEALRIVPDSPQYQLLGFEILTCRNDHARAADL